MTKESKDTLEPRYNPSDVEKRWLGYWEEAGLTRAEAGSEKPAFSMVIPPPNITGALHVGHALNSTLQDILARYKRMQGFNVLWLPGIDHAGIATQNVVERDLAAEGTDRHATGRERFIERVWEWKEKYGTTILNQLARLGASCDWSRLRFTMDEGLSKAVREVFVTLYDEGLIYRGDYIINWCPRCRTALSDLEVSFEEKDGSLYYMRYPVADPPEGGPDEIIVATTRPETLLGDTAVAVNPEDERYQGLRGRKVCLPFLGREIPVIEDDHVSMEFGTGAVKITPAHDFDDFEMGRRHGLSFITVMDSSGVMNENAGPFAGLDRFEARKKVVEELRKENLLQKVEPHKLMLGSCYRCSTVVEPTLSKQWFVNIKPLAGPAIEAVEDGRVRFIPKNWENLYFDWMRNIRDWCISRQIWWGHRIPAWHCGDCSHTTVAKADPSECEECGSTNITQDQDVLDTWFSSALWPFSTLGWPDDTPELRTFYPTDVLSTSFDIIFFWVARMIMMGMKFMGDVPFKDVYIHALIRDAEGQKMSKSRGNVIDPLVMIEEFGTDAFRFTLAVLAAQGRDIKLSTERIEGYRNFCNKIWNLARFTLMNVDGPVDETVGEERLARADKWILSRLALTTAGVTEAIDSYRFDEAARLLYRFVWHELCDWYVELSKKDLRGENGEDRRSACMGVLVSVLRDTLRLLHPFMPFITEEIHACLPGESGSLLASRWPSRGQAYENEAREMDLVMEIIKAVRNMKTEMHVALKTPVKVFCFTRCQASSQAIRSGLEYIGTLAGVEELVLKKAGDEPPEKSVSARAGEGDSLVEVFLPMEGLVDVAVEGRRLEKALAKVLRESESLEKKLANRAFLEKAPQEIVEKEKARLGTLLEKKASIEAGLERLKGL